MFSLVCDVGGSSSLPLVLVAVPVVLFSSSLLSTACWVGICIEEMRGASVSEGLGEDCPAATATDGEVCEMVSELEAVVVVLVGVNWDEPLLLEVGINWEAVLESSCASELARLTVSVNSWEDWDRSSEFDRKNEVTCDAILSAMEAILLIWEADGEREAAQEGGGCCCCEGDSEVVAEPARGAVEATVD